MLRVEVITTKDEADTYDECLSKPLLCCAQSHRNEQAGGDWSGSSACRFEPVWHRRVCLKPWRCSESVDRLQALQPGEQSRMSFRFQLETMPLMIKITDQHQLGRSVLISGERLRLSKDIYQMTINDQSHL